MLLGNSFTAYKDKEIRNRGLDYGSIKSTVNKDTFKENRCYDLKSD